MTMGSSAAGLLHHRIPGSASGCLARLPKILLGQPHILNIQELALPIFCKSWDLGGKVKLTSRSPFAEIVPAVRGFYM